MRKFYFLFSFLFVSIQLYSQKEANNWYFGQKAGITFNSGAPVALTNGQLQTLEGCSSISDASGNLLFYTDGIKVWNRNHVVMTNGTNLKGDPSSSQSGIIVPKPGNPNVYYIFTVDMQGGLALFAGGDADGVSNGFMYSEVDMTLNGGLGDIVVARKNVALKKPTTEGLCAVKHSNGTDIWVVVHGINNTQYSAFLVTAAGVNLVPVNSNVGPSVTVTAGNYGSGSIGYMKISPNGKKIAACHAFENKQLVLSDFNTTTGAVTNPITIGLNLNGDSDGPYGVEFSSCNEYLYVSETFSQEDLFWGTSWPSATRIWRFDLNAGSIPASKALFKLNNNEADGALQLAPDGNIYVAKMQRTGGSVLDYGYAYGTTLHRIDNPRLVGATFTNNAVNLAGRLSAYGLPPFIASYFYNSSFSTTNVVTGDTALFCNGDSILFKGTTNAYDSIRWYFGDPVTGINNTSTLLNPKHLFSSNGAFTIQFYKYLCGVKDSASKVITIYKYPVITDLVDKAICTGGSITLDGTALPVTSYLWSTGAVTPTISVSTPGKYVLTADNNGCKAKDSMNLTISSPVTTNISQAICNGNSFVFNGQSITTPGTYRDTLLRSNSCDSFIILTVTLKTSPTTNITQSICQGSSIVFNGNTISTAGTFRDTLTTSLGCDSFMVLTTTLKPTPTTNITQSICQGSSIVFNGNNISTAGTFRDTLTTSLGCDSFIVLTTTIKPTPTTNIAQSICNGSSIVFNGNTISSAGSYRDTLITSLGCDSFIVLTVTIKPTPTTNIAQAICNGSSIVFNGNTITTAGVFRDTLTTSLGCDSFIVLTTSLQSTPTTNIAQSICNGSSIVFNGNTISTAGTFRDTLSTSLGCDSFIVLTTTIKPTPTTNITQSICNGSSIVFNGNTITTAGVFRDTLTTSLGCDSFIVLTTTIKPTPTTNIAQSICNGSSIVFNGNTITTAGVFRDTLSTSLGCDSFIVMTVSIRPTPTTNLTQSICQGNSIVFNGNTITTAGVFRDTLTTSLACDSFIILTVTIKSTPTTNIAQAICQGSSIVFNGNTITTAGTFRDTLSTSLGCDSFIVLTTTIKPTPTTNLTHAICQGSSIVFNGNTITTAGIFRDTLSTSLGCDSFIVLTTTIKPTPTTNISQSICQGSSIVFNGNTIMTAGVFRDTLTTSLGCDSFIILTTTIKPTPTTNLTQAICQGSSIVFNGNTITTAGVFRDTLTTSLGCDSFIVLTTTIKPTPTTNLTQAICQGNSIVFNGNTIITAGVYRDTLTTSLGCDSFIVLTTTIKPTPTTNITQSICNGSSIVFNGNTITTAGIFRDTLTTSLGCDSFIVLTTTINSTPSTNLTQSICQGNSIVFNGNTITTAGIYRDTLATSLGCDSFIVLTVTIKPIKTTNIAQAICSGSSIVFNGNTISSAGVYRDTLTTSVGCDSFIVLTVSVNSVIRTTLTPSICFGSSVSVGTHTYSSTGIYLDTLTSAQGCDSIITTRLTVNPKPTTNITQAICNGSSIVFNGNTISTAGVFRDTLTTSLGCDSFIVLTTTIKPTPTTNITQSICNGSSIVFNGNTITTAGVFRDTLTTSLGCDSLIVLTTTIKPTPTTNLTQAICQGNSIVFNGNTITSAGTFRDTLSTSLGCDSFIVFNDNHQTNTNYESNKIYLQWKFVCLQWKYHHQWRHLSRYANYFVRMR
jgi:hypothetical protein